MATIKPRKKAERRDPVHRDRSASARARRSSTANRKTFAHRTAAASWAKHREVALENPEELRRAQEQKQASLETYQLKTLIKWYIDSFRAIGNWQRTKQTTLEFLERHPIGETDARYLTSSDLVEHIRKRRAEGTGPSTVGNDLTWIGVVLRAAKASKAPSACRSIQKSWTRHAMRAEELRLIAKSRRRERRATEEEIQRLDEYFGRRDRRSKIPMRDIWHFARKVDEARGRNLPH